MAIGSTADLECVAATSERIAVVCVVDGPRGGPFCGLTNKEVADAQGIAVKTVESDWTFAKAWLQRRLGESG